MDDEARLRQLAELDVGRPVPVAELEARTRRRRTRRQVTRAAVACTLVLALVIVAVVARPRSEDRIDTATVPPTSDAGQPSTSATIGPTTRPPPSITASVPVGRFAYHSVTDGRTLWVLNKTDSSVTRIDEATATVVSTVDLPSSFGSLDRLALGAGAVWVAGLAPRSGAGTGGSVARIDLATEQVTQFDTVGGPVSIAVAGDDVWIGTFAQGSAALEHLDARTAHVDAPIPLPHGAPVDVAVTDEGVWVLGQTKPDSWLVLVGPTSGAVVDRIEVPAFAVRLVVDGGSIVIGTDTGGGGGRTGALHVLDARTRSMIAGRQLDVRPEGIVVTPDAIITSGLRAYERRTLEPLALDPALSTIGGFTVAGTDGTVWASRYDPATGLEAMVRVDVRALG